jgi:phage tail tape-measure protein
MSQGLNPIEATGRAAAGTGAYALGSTIGSSIGGAIGTAIPIPGVGTAAGTLVGGILGGMTASWLADKTIDAAIGDDQEKIRLSQLQKRLAEGETGERQYSYNSIPTEQAIERQRSPYDYRAERYLPQPTQFAQPQQVQLRRWNEEGY